MSFRRQEEKETLCNKSGASKVSAINLPSSDSDDDVILMEVGRDSSPDETFPDINVTTPVNKERAKHSVSSLHASQACKVHKGLDHRASPGISENGLLTPSTERKAHAGKGSSPALGKKTLASGQRSVPSRPETKAVSQPWARIRTPPALTVSQRRERGPFCDGHTSHVSNETRVSAHVQNRTDASLSVLHNKSPKRHKMILNNSPCRPSVQSTNTKSQHPHAVKPTQSQSSSSPRTGSLHVHHASHKHPRAKQSSDSSSSEKERAVAHDVSKKRERAHDTHSHDAAGGVRAHRASEGEKTNSSKSHKKDGNHSTVGSGGPQPVKGKESQGKMGKPVNSVERRVEGNASGQTLSQAARKMPLKGTPLSLGEQLPGASNRGGTVNRVFHVPEPPSVLPDDLRSDDSCDHHTDTPRSQAHALETGGRSTTLITPRTPTHDPPPRIVSADSKQKVSSSGRNGSNHRDAPTKSAGLKPAGKKGQAAQHHLDKSQKSKLPSSTGAVVSAVTTHVHVAARNPVTTTIAATAGSTATTTAATNSSVSADTAGTFTSTTPFTSNSTKSLDKEKDDETEGSLFDFGEDDYYEVLDSVETDSLCSAYNQSDMESTTVGSDDPSSRLPSEADQVLPVVPSNLTKSFSQQQLPSNSHASLPTKRRQFARKSTGNRFRYYKHPTRGLMRLRKYCTLELKRVEATKFMKRVLAKGGKAQSQEHATKKGMVKDKYLSYGKHGISTCTSFNQDSHGQSGREEQLMKKRKHLFPESIQVLAKKPKHLSGNPSKKHAHSFTLGTASTIGAANGMKQRKEPQQKPSTSSDGTLTPSSRSSHLGSEVPTSGASQLIHTFPSSNQASLKSVSLPPQASSSTSQLSAKHTKYVYYEFLESDGDSTLCAPSESEQDMPQSPAGFGEHQMTGGYIGPAVKPSAPGKGDGTSGLQKELGEADRLAERRVTSEPSTPVGKKCLSLKRNNITRTISFSDPPQSTPVETPTTASVSRTDTSSAGQASTVDQHERLRSTVVHVSSHPPPRRISGKVICSAVDTSPQSETQEAMDEESTARSQRDEAYDMRLQETIAKLTPEDMAVDSVFQRRLPLRGMEGTEMMEEEEEGESDKAHTPLLVRVPLGCLRRRPALPLGPMVSTRPLGMFTDRGVQAELGMIVDKEVLDAYLVVKLHEAMFDMKEQLQMMEAQVANILKQKESLERTLQSKIKYIRDMTSTGFKPGVVDVATETDPHLSGSPDPVRNSDRTTVATQTRKFGSSKPYKPVKMMDVGTQVGKRPPTHITVACQTEGVVRYVPARLQDVQQPPCLYNHPDREIQLYIDRGKEIVPSEYSRVDDNYGEVPPPNEQWLSMSVWGSCSRCVPVSQKIRFLRAMKEKAREWVGCARCLPVERSTRSSGQAPARKDVTVPKVQFSQPEAAAGASTSQEGAQTLPSEGKRDEGKEDERGCIPVTLQAPIDNLMQLYFKLESIPKTPVLARHMSALLRAVHHLLSHLPVPLEPKKGCSPPSTPGTAAWSMGAKLQELMESLRELKEQGEELLPAYFLAELAQLQQMVQDTLGFATSGIQNETFTHNQLGCIVDSDLQLRPWRNQDLRENPYFRRLCLDVGMRGIVQQMKQLQNRNIQGKRLAEPDSETDSDVDSLISSHPPSPPPAQLRKKASKPAKKAKSVVKKKGRKTKFTVKRLRPTQRKPKRIAHLSIPASEQQPRSSQSEGVVSTSSRRRPRQSSSSSIAMDTDVSPGPSMATPHMSRRPRMSSKTSEITSGCSPTATLAVSSSASRPRSNSTGGLGASSKSLDSAPSSSSISAMAASSLPSLTASESPSTSSSKPSETATSSSPSSVSPRMTSMSVCNSLIASGKSVQMRVMDVQSQVSTTLASSAAIPTPSVQPKPAPQAPSMALPRPQVLANHDAFGGNPILTQFLVNQINELLGKSNSGSMYTVSDAVRAIAQQEQLKTTLSRTAGHSGCTTPSSAHPSRMTQVSVAQIQREANSCGFATLSGARLSKPPQVPPMTSLVQRQPVNVELVENLLNRFVQQQQATAKRGHPVAVSCSAPTASVIARPLTSLPSSVIPRIPHVLPLPPITTGSRTATPLASSFTPSLGAPGLAPSFPPVGVFPLPHLRALRSLPANLSQMSTTTGMPAMAMFPTPLLNPAAVMGNVVRGVSSSQPMAPAPSIVTSHPYPVVMATSVPITTSPPVLPQPRGTTGEASAPTQTATTVTSTSLAPAATTTAPVVAETPKEGDSVCSAASAPVPPPSSSVSAKDSVAAVAGSAPPVQRRTPDEQAKSAGQCDKDTTAQSSRLGDTLAPPPVISSSGGGMMMVQSAVQPAPTMLSNSGSKGSTTVGMGTERLAKSSATTAASVGVKTLPLILSSSAKSKIVKASIMGGNGQLVPSTSQPAPSMNGTSQPVPSTNVSSQPASSSTGSNPSSAKATNQPIPFTSQSVPSTIGSSLPVPSTVNNSLPVPSSSQSVPSTTGSSLPVPSTSTSSQAALSTTTDSQPVSSVARKGQLVPSTKGGHQPTPSVKGGRQPAPSVKGGRQPAPSVKGGSQSVPSVKGGSQSIPHAKGRTQPRRDGQSIPSAKGGQPVSSVKSGSQIVPSANVSAPSAAGSNQPVPSTTTGGSANIQPTTGSSGSSHPAPSLPQPPKPTDSSTDSATHTLPSTPSLTAPVLGASKDSGPKPPSTVAGSHGVNEREKKTATSDEVSLRRGSSEKPLQRDTSLSPPASAQSPMSSPVLTSRGVVIPDRITKEENIVSVPPRSTSKQSDTAQPLPLSSSTSVTQSSSGESPSSSSSDISSISAVTKTSTLVTTATMAPLSAALHIPIVSFPPSTAMPPTSTTPVSHTLANNPSPQLPVSATSSLAKPTHPPQVQSSSSQQLQTVSHPIHSTASHRPAILPSLPAPHTHLTSTPYLPYPLNESFPATKVQVTKVPNGLLIKWTFASEHLSWQNLVERYELYAFVCNRGTDIPHVSQWGKVGEIKPLALPMAVTLTNFASGQCYAFSVRVHYVGGGNRFSEPCTIEL